jgi:hypothetical protein
MPWDAYNQRLGRNGNGRLKKAASSVTFREDNLGRPAAEMYGTRVAIAIEQSNFELAHEIVEEAKAAADEQARKRPDKRERASYIAQLEFANVEQGIRMVNGLEEDLGLLHISSLLTYGREDLLALPNFGHASIKLLADAMRREGFCKWADSLEGKETTQGREPC